MKLVLGHVSFPEKIAERRMCGFLFQKKVMDAPKDRQSPVLLEGINSCDIKVSFSAFHTLVFGSEFDCSFIVYSTLAKPISIVCLRTCTDRDRSNLLLPFYRLNLTV